MLTRDRVKNCPNYLIMIVEIAVASVCVIILGAVILTLVVMAIRHHLKYRGGHGNFVMLDDMMENSADD